MADSITNPVLSVCTTVESKLAELAIQNGQLIFVRDKHKIALDFGGKRTVYNQIEELSTETARTSILAPVIGRYYFVVETSVLWTYRNGWVQITTPPTELDKKQDAFTVDETLILENGILKVNTTNNAEADNTLPITSAGVHTVVGNIEVLLDTI